MKDGAHFPSAAEAVMILLEMSELLNLSRPKPTLLIVHTELQNFLKVVRSLSELVAGQ
jgi:hypothetical protein